MRGLHALMVLFALAWEAPAEAVIIASGDGTGNTSAPLDDPGWDSVGKLHIWTGVYIGDGWVLTADHVGEGDMTFASTPRRIVPGSEETVAPADLKLLRLESDPGVPAAVIASDPPQLFDEVVMIGQGRNRGTATSYDPTGPGGPYDGWNWGAGRALRWGTNEVEATDRILLDGIRTTVSFLTDLSQHAATDHEAQAAGGDSGGAVFAMGSGGWALAGIMLTIVNHAGQPADTALYGNETWCAQLADYRDEILWIVNETPPACNDGADDDGDGLVDYPDDPGCSGPDDAFETSDTLPCDDGIDNDGDGGVDFDPATAADPGDESNPPAGEGDPGCRNPGWMTESPKCQDGLDNDGDGRIDYDAGLSRNGFADLAGPDEHCVARPDRNCEKGGCRSCGLGAELALLLTAWLWIWRRRRGIRGS
jgi:hypothetical protein